MERLTFAKMHGLGNDFVVLDVRGREDPAGPAFARAVGDRHRGVGFDQLVVIGPPRDPVALARIRFWNADGSPSGACGNGLRCAARRVLEDAGLARCLLETEQGLLAAEVAGDDIRVNMGPPGLGWDAIPLAYPMDTLALPLDGAPVAVSMGNPHAVFLVPDAEAVDVAREGAAIEVHPIFPERTNVEFVQVLDHATLRLRVWERGTGLTSACGSGACAATVAAARRGLAGREVRVLLDGGPLDVSWREDGVWLTGPAALVFEGSFAPEFLEGP